jgi:hypothetical protein
MKTRSGIDSLIKSLMHAAPFTNSDLTSGVWHFMSGRNQRRRGFILLQSEMT